MGNLLNPHRYIRQEIACVTSVLKEQEKACLARLIKEGNTELGSILEEINSRYRDSENKPTVQKELEEGDCTHIYVLEINLRKFLTSGNLKVQNERKEFVRQIVHGLTQDKISQTPDDPKAKDD